MGTSCSSLQRTAPERGAIGAATVPRTTLYPAATRAGSPVAEYDSFLGRAKWQKPIPQVYSGPHAGAYASLVSSASSMALSRTASLASHTSGLSTQQDVRSPSLDLRLRATPPRGTLEHSTQWSAGSSGPHSTKSSRSAKSCRSGEAELTPAYSSGSSSDDGSRTGVDAVATCVRQTHDDTLPVRVRLNSRMPGTGGGYGGAYRKPLRDAAVQERQQLSTSKAKVDASAAANSASKSAFVATRAVRAKSEPTINVEVSIDLPTRRKTICSHTLSAAAAAGRSAFRAPAAKQARAVINTMPAAKPSATATARQKPTAATANASAGAPATCSSSAKPSAGASTAKCSRPANRCPSHRRARHTSTANCQIVVKPKALRSRYRGGGDLVEDAAAAAARFSPDVAKRGLSRVRPDASAFQPFSCSRSAFAPPKDCTLPPVLSRRNLDLADLGAAGDYPEAMDARTCTIM